MSVISIDLRMLHSSGIGTYLRNLVPLVIATSPRIKFYLLGRKGEVSQYSWARGENIILIDCHAPIYSLTEQLEFFRKIPRETTLFWSTHYNIPLLYYGKLLVTVHDVFHLAMPHLVGGVHKRLYARAMMVAVRHKASAILCDSDFTRKELIRLTGLGHQELHVVHLGINESWFHVKEDKNPYPKPFLLYVGNIKPHKNLMTLIKAFEGIMDKIPHDLVVVGKKEGFITGDKAVARKAAGLLDRIHFTGYIEDNMLHQYVTHADALVHPSLYEGFGLPPLEAMACGCPVIVSDAGSLPEVCGDAALYCDPYSSKNVADKILQLIKNVALREKMRQRGFLRVKGFTWEKCARETLAIIEKVLAQ